MDLPCLCCGRKVDNKESLPSVWESKGSNCKIPFFFLFRVSKYGVFSSSSSSFEDLEKPLGTISTSGLISLFPQLLTAAGMSDCGL